VVVVGTNELYGEEFFKCLIGRRFNNRREVIQTHRIYNG
jgi:hypothetical protein